VTTGGITSGKWIAASATDLPQKSRRANSHATAIPSGVATSVATVATRSESWIAVHSVGEMSNTRRDQEVGRIRYVNPYFSRIVFAADDFRKAR
jgi:hypothetical protein